MIKIESIKENTTATINNGIPVYTGQLISHEEYSTLKVSGGSVVVSIDELDIVTINDDEKEKLRIAEELIKQKELEELIKQKEVQKEVQKVKETPLAKPATKHSTKSTSAKSMEILDTSYPSDNSSLCE